MLFISYHNGYSQQELKIAFYFDQASKGLMNDSKISNRMDRLNNYIDNQLCNNNTLNAIITDKIALKSWKTPKNRTSVKYLNGEYDAMRQIYNELSSIHGLFEQQADLPEALDHLNTDCNGTCVDNSDMPTLEQVGKPDIHIFIVDETKGPQDIYLLHAPLDDDDLSIAIVKKSYWESTGDADWTLNHILVGLLVPNLAEEVDDIYFSEDLFYNSIPFTGNQSDGGVIEGTGENSLINQAIANALNNKSFLSSVTPSDGKSIKLKRSVTNLYGESKNDVNGDIIVDGTETTIEYSVDENYNEGKGSVEFSSKKRKYNSPLTCISSSVNSKNVSDEHNSQPTIEKHIDISSPLTLYPNPFTHTFKVVYDRAENAGSVVLARVYDLSGRVALEQQFAVGDAASVALEIDGSNLSIGHYIIELNDGSGTPKRGRLIKER